MPAPAATVNQATLLKAIDWSLKYLLDEKRGKGKNLPSSQEIEKQFPNSNITPDLIEFELKNLFNVDSIEKIQILTREQIQEVVAKIQTPGKEQAAKQARVSFARPTAAPAKSVSALGVLAELEAIEPILRKHNLETSAKLGQSLKPQVQSLITQLGVKDLPQDQFENLSQGIAQEVARETLENVPKIADLAQIPDVVTDSLVQTLLVDPALAPRLQKLDEVKLVEKAAGIADQISQAHNQDLEKSAVLGSLAEISKLAKPNQEILDTIAANVQQIVETHAPLTPPQNQQILTASLGTYLVSYLDEVKKQLPTISPTSLPSFEKLQKIKEEAHNRTTEKVGTFLAQKKDTQQVARQIDPATLTGNLAVAQRLAPPKVAPPSAPALLTGAFLILNSDKKLQEGNLALLTHDQEWFNKEQKKLATQIENFQKRNALNYQERKESAQAQIKFAKLQKAQELRAKNPKRRQAYLNLFRNNLEVFQASYTARSFFNERYGYFIPRTIINSPRFGPRFAFATIAPGSLSLFGKIAPGFSSSISHLTPAAGMGMGPTLVTGLTPQGILLGIGRKIRNISAAVLGGLGLYFLGKAAFTGFLIGATAGATAGAAFGIGVSIALGPIGWIAAPVIIPLMFTGGIIGGAAGGLIGLGLASGSTTAVTAGIGAGVGGVTGAVIGGTLGSALGPVGTLVGATLGAYIGAFVGGAAGYLLGHYVLASTLGTVGFGAGLGFFFGGPLGALSGALIGWLAKGGWIQIKNFFAGTPSAVAGAGAGFFGAAAGFFTGLASTIWGGLSAAGGAIVGFFGSAANFIVGGLGSLAVPASAAAIPVAGSIGAVAVGGTIVGIVTAATFFNPGGEFELRPAGPPGENQFVTLEKTVFANELRLGPDKSIHFGNDELPEPLKFEVKVKPKTNLADLNCSDRLTLTKQGGTRQEIPLPAIPPCPAKLDAGQEFSFSFELTAEAPKYKNALVTNTFSLSGYGALTPTSSSGVAVSFSQSVVATVLIGEAPISDPQDWPTCGYIGQGPYTNPPRSHSSSPFRPSMDIWNNIGTKIYATHEGTVIAAGFEHTNAIYVAIRGVNYTTYYVHLLSFNPELYIGKLVDTGTLIGYMDTTGAYAGGISHLHYMIYDKNGAEISLEQFNSLVPPYKEGETVTSSWGPC